MDDLPTYVPRDLDEHLCTRITTASERGGFVLLTGGSSVGKTRTLFEAVRAVLPNWALVHPDSPQVIRYIAATPRERTIVWLDELQNYLDHPDPLTAVTIRELITAQQVLVATLWPDEYTIRTTLRTAGQPDPHAKDRDLLSLAEVVSVPGRFSHAERNRAELVKGDTRILYRSKSRRGWSGRKVGRCDHGLVIVSLLYQLTRRPLSVPAVLLRHNTTKDAEMLALRHENAVLRRQIPGQVRYEPADRFWFTALSSLLPNTAGTRSSPSNPRPSWPGTADSSPGNSTTAHTPTPHRTATHSHDDQEARP